MRNTDLYTAVSGIEEKYLLASENTEDIKKAFKKERITKNTVVTSICLIILFGIMHITGYTLPSVPVTDYPDPGNMIDNGDNSQTSPEQTMITPAEENSSPLNGSSVLYTDLTKDGHGFHIIGIDAEADILGFSESMLKNDSLLIEGTVLDSYIKKYHLIVETDGKFEHAGEKLKAVREPESLVTVIKVDKIWKNDRDISVGDTIVIENEELAVERTVGYHIGSSYFLHLAKYSEENSIVHYGITPNEKIIEGDNHRESRYLNSYPYQPDIEKAVNGDYIVPCSWTSIAMDSDDDVILSDQDLEGIEPDSLFWYQKGMKLVSSENFESRMSALLKDLESSSETEPYLMD